MAPKKRKSAAKTKTATKKKAASPKQPKKAASPKKKKGGALAFDVYAAADEGVVPWYSNVSVSEPDADGDVEFLKRKFANLWNCRTPLRKPGGDAPERAERAASAKRPIW